MSISDYQDDIRASVDAVLNVVDIDSGSPSEGIVRSHVELAIAYAISQERIRCVGLAYSQYVVNGCNDWRHGWKKQGWKRGKKELANADLWQAIDAVLSGADRVTIAWVKGHAGVVGNERADELATMGRDLVRGEPELTAIEQQLQYVV
ncbi:RNase H family protein [Ochrobactrum sp. MYb379]|uniref:RNase H family protein n=1 Tax=Ochrobactrum sp. MYb379 TaxID=2745275 RepID=UPI00309A61DE